MEFKPSFAALYHTLLENFHGLVLATDEEGLILYANRYVLERKFPELGEKIIGMTMQELVDEGHITASATVETIKTKQQTIKPIDIPNSGDEQMSVMTISTPILNERGEIDLIFALSIDEFFTKTLIQRIEAEKCQMRYLLNYLHGARCDVEFVAESPSMKEIVSLALRIATSDSPIMIYGESGTGKEVLAKFIYKNSARNRQPFIPVNCAAIPPTLMESEFFGYEKGAFTGAVQAGKPGLFELANGGTLFLDEIGELPLSLQSALLRVIESGEVKRIGSGTLTQVDTRIIAATNRNLMDMVVAGAFRRDLYYRLNVLPVYIPPLRQRGEDIRALATLFLGVYNRKYNTKKIFALGMLEQMVQYAWPGNVRELKNLINRKVLISSSDYLQFNLCDEAGQVEQAQRAMSTALTGDGLPLRESVKRFEQQYITAVLKETEGNIVLAADKLGIHRSNLYKKISEYSITVEE